MAKTLKLERRGKSQQKRMKTLLTGHLGDTDNVTDIYYNKKRLYKCGCQECGVINSAKLAHHLQNKYNYYERKAMLLQTMTVMFLWFPAKKHKMSLRLPCLVCEKWQLRLDQHLKKKTVVCMSMNYIALEIIHRVSDAATSVLITMCYWWKSLCVIISYLRHGCVERI